MTKEEKVNELTWEYIESVSMPMRYEETAMEAYKAGLRMGEKLMIEKVKNIIDTLVNDTRVKKSIVNLIES